MKTLLFCCSFLLCSCVGATKWSDCPSVAILYQGDSFTMRCRSDTTILITHKEESYVPVHSVYTQGKVINGYRERHAVVVRDNHTYILLVGPVYYSDAGLYQCIDNEGLGDPINSTAVYVIPRPTCPTPSPTATSAQCPTPSPTAPTEHSPCTSILSITCAVLAVALAISLLAHCLRTRVISRVDPLI